MTPSSHRIQVRDVLLAGAALVAALAFTVWLSPQLPHTRLMLLYGAVAVATTLGGWRLGLAGLVAAVALTELFVFRVPGDFQSAPDVVSRGVLFAIVALGVVIVVDRLRSTHRAALARTEHAEQLTQRLREKAGQLELQFRQTTALARELEQVNRQYAERSAAAMQAAFRAERLQHFTARLLEHHGEHAAALVIVEEGLRAVEAQAAVVVKVRECGATGILAVGGAEVPDAAEPAALSEAASPLREALQTGDAVWVTDASAAASVYPGLGQFGDAPAGAWAALPLRIEQRTVGVLGFAFKEPVEFRPEDRSFMLLVAQQCAQALDRARVYDLERSARVRAVFAERRLAFLAEASNRLARSLDYRPTLVDLAEQSVPEFAEWCSIQLLDNDGRPRLIAVAHRDAELVERRWRLEEDYPTALTADAGAGRVLRTGEVQHILNVDDDVLRAIARNEEHFELMRSLGIREQISAPIRVDERIHGVILFGMTDPTRSFDEADVTLAEELGLRAGQAVTNARLYQAAHHASEAKSNFLAVISHELRTPLNAITGYSDLLLLGVPSGIPEQATRQVERIRMAASALLHLVEEVLSFSRIEAGKEEVRISPVDLNGLIRDSAAMVEPMVAEKNLDLRLDLPDEQLKIVSDERKIRQIIANLLSNAVKFTEAGTLDVVLRSSADGVTIAVSDTGIGIPEEYLERIFDPFWQVEPASTRRFGGTGLGLGVARKLARLLGGELTVRSEEGKGSTFSLSLPVGVQPASRGV